MPSKALKIWCILSNCTDKIWWILNDFFVGKSVLKSNLFAWENAAILNYSLEKMQESQTLSRLSV